MRAHLLMFTILAFVSCNNSSDSKQIPAETFVQKKYWLDRPGYLLQYYPNWTIDSTDKDFDLDSFFTLNPPVENGFATFFIYGKSTDEKENVEAQVLAHLRTTMKNGKVIYFEKLGNYTGHGAMIQGKMKGIDSAEIKIFSHSSGSQSFLLVVGYSTIDKAIVSPGIELIENSFKLK